MSEALRALVRGRVQGVGFRAFVVWKAHELSLKGFARNLSDGIIRARFRQGTDAPRPITPGEPLEYTIDLWATSNVFKQGHQLRLYVSSSNFPRFNRNPNTGEAMLGASRMVSARQTIYHDRKYSSALTLPIIPRQQ